MQQRYQSVTNASESVFTQNAVLRNTFLLLSLTTLFSAVCAYFSLVSGAQPVGFIAMLLIYMGLIFAIQAFKDSSFGLVLVFAFTGFLGYTLGPILNLYLNFVSNGPAIVSTALFGTASIFGGLTCYAMITKEKFSYLGGFLTIGTLTVIGLSLLNAFVFQLPIFSLILSCGILLISSGWILFELSAIIHGGQTNYILATVHIFVQLYNIFLSLLQILQAFSSRD
jgi:modulator of FtsH protease